MRASRAQDPASPPSGPAGTLYVCSTPIGNLEDISLRALRVLKEVDRIAAEDTRETRKLLAHYDIHTPLVSYHRHSSANRERELLAWLRSGESIALVSTAGTPGLSDPGADLVRACVAEEIRVVPVPGPSCAAAALAASGLDGQSFSFLGFAPRHTGKRREMLARLKDRTETLVFLESPHRLADLLEALAEVLGDRQAVIAREMTKRFEEFVRGSLSELVARFHETPPRGEFTVVVEGALGCGQAAVGMQEEEVAAARRCYAELCAQGVERKIALRQAAQMTGVSRNRLYRELLGGL